jgi:hypothetical protein
LTHGQLPLVLLTVGPLPVVAPVRQTVAKPVRRVSLG